MNENEQLIDAVVKAATETDGRRKLPCASAFQLAERFGVRVMEIGQICNDNDIRITNCQLGCFK